jgi:hypothetical protein
MCAECAFHQIHDGTVEKDGGLAPEPHGWTDDLKIEKEAP